MTELTAMFPQVNQLVRLQVASGVEVLRSRVESIDNRRVLVAAPTEDESEVVEDLTGPRPVDYFIGTPPDPGSTVFLLWTSSRGEVRVQGRMIGVEKRTVPAWELEVTGPITVNQRRRHVRVQTDIRVAMDRLDPPGTAAIGTTMDLSEGAFRCRFPESIGLEPPSRVAMTFDLEGLRCQITGRVHEVYRTMGELQAVIVFDEPVACAQEIRKFVLQTQIRQRRAEQSL